MEDLIESVNLNSIQSVQYKNALEIDYVIHYMENKLRIKDPSTEIAEINKQRQKQIVKEQINEIKKPKDQEQTVKSFDVSSNEIIEGDKNSPNPRFLRKAVTKIFSKSIATLPLSRIPIQEAHTKSQDEPSKIQLNYQQINLKPIGSRDRAE